MLLIQLPLLVYFYLTNHTPLSYANLLNLLNRFNGILEKTMRKAAHPSGGVGSSNPHRLRGWGLHHHGDGVC
jgi:hypothetical protein